MTEFLGKLSELMSKDFFFWFCALSGSGLFIIQILLTLLGVMDQDDLDDNTELDAGKVKWLSKQAITGFLMMFGWSALACKHELGFGEALSLTFAFAVGVLTVLITGSNFKAARKLHSSGTVFRLEDAVGKEAVVYQRIPKEGIGKISIALNNMTHEIDAVSLNEELASFVSVQIIKKLDDKTVVVVPIKK